MPILEARAKILQKISFAFWAMEQVAGVSRKIAFDISSPLGIYENSLMDILLQFSYLLDASVSKIFKK